MAKNVLYKSSVDSFDGLDDTEKILKAMCGVGSFNNTRIFSTASRPVVLTKINSKCPVAKPRCLTFMTFVATVRGFCSQQV